MHPIPVPSIEPEDVIDGLLLASDRARYVTGTQLKVDAGYIALRRNPVRARTSSPAAAGRY